MSERSAEYTILGFYYQFDKNIFEILNLQNDNDVITVEGVEDIDISSATEDIAMQIKYQEKTKGTDSIFRKPISLMLKHFNEDTTTSLNYILYGHYSNNSDIEQLFDLVRIKSMMKYTENKAKKDFLADNNISDETVEKFLKKFKLVLGESFDKHQKNTFEKIKRQFSLSKNEEIETYYSNALKVVHDLAVKRTLASRKITKKDFIEKINLKNILFNYWFIELKGREKYLKHIYSQYFKSGLNTHNYERIFIINTTSNNKEYLKDAIYEIENKYYKKSRTMITSSAPYIFIKNITQTDLCILKETIYLDGKSFNDGFYFSGSSFKCKEIRKESTIENNVSLKFINKQEHLDEILNDIQSTKKVYELYDKNNNSVSGNEDYIVKIQLEDLVDIPKLIRGK